jgi:hypothetical protein
VGEKDAERAEKESQRVSDTHTHTHTHTHTTHTHTHAHTHTHTHRRTTFNFRGPKGDCPHNICGFFCRCYKSGATTTMISITTCFTHAA